MTLFFSSAALSLQTIRVHCSLLVEEVPSAALAPATTSTYAGTMTPAAAGPMTPATARGDNEAAPPQSPPPTSLELRDAFHRAAVKVFDAGLNITESRL